MCNFLYPNELRVINQCGNKWSILDVSKILCLLGTCPVASYLNTLCQIKPCKIMYPFETCLNAPLPRTLLMTILKETRFVSNLLRFCYQKLAIDFDDICVRQIWLSGYKCKENWLSQLFILCFISIP